MQLKSLIPIPFNQEKLKEYYDNPPMLFYIFGALVWGLISVLLSASVGNIFNIAVTLLFMVLIFGSISSLDFIIKDFHLDFKEGFKPMNLVFSAFGVMLIFVVIIFVGAISKTSFSSLWWTIKFDLPALTTTQAMMPLVELHANFFGFFSSIGINPNLAFNILQTVFLVAPAEELVFRGVFTYVFGIIAGTVWTGGIIATFLWSMVHSICAYVSGDVIAMLFIALFGGFIMLGMMVYTKDISTAINIHAIYNTISMLTG